MELSITEKFLLLAQHPSKGKFIINEVQLKHGIIGALLLEMSVDKKIDIQNDELILKSSKRSRDPIVSEIEEQIRQAPKPKKIKNWVNKLARKSNRFKKILLADMQKKRLIRIQKKRFIGLIPYQLHFLANVRVRQELIKELKKCLLTKQQLSNDQVVLLGLVEACKMYAIFPSDKAELKIIKKRLKEIIDESPIADSVDKTIKQVQAAVLTAVIASAVVTSAGSS